uniref:Phostensin/Taperin PP1-binding domain-containing protein n=1 Tax=Sparus aurata TaxID=8175 RepID=A0A671XW06_SPAAU
MAAYQAYGLSAPMVQRRKGNTFTVVPKRRSEAEAQPSSPEPQQEASSVAPPGSTPPQAPYAQLGSLLKKRYPAVEEIEVVGGYLSLAKSCLSKTGSTGKKPQRHHSQCFHLKISFNESSLASTYEYPSESSTWDMRQPRKEIPLVILATQNSCRIITAFSEHTPAPQRMNILNFEHPKLAPL